MSEADHPLPQQKEPPTSDDLVQVAPEKQEQNQGENIGFDYFNVLVYHNSARESIELMVSVPLTDGAAAEAKVTLRAPVRFPNKEERFEYRMDIKTSLSVIQAEQKPTGSVEVAARDGLNWEIPAGYPGAWTALLEHEPRVREFLMSYFRAGQVFVDVGANVGAYSLRAASNGMKVYSFEPNPENVKVLKRNAEVNNLSVELLEYALGSTEGKVNLSPNGATTRVSSTGTLEAPLRTLDSFELPRVDLLKVDVEGYELEVLKGSRKTLERCHPTIMVELHDWLTAEDGASLFNILLENNYDFQYLDKYAHGRHLIAFQGQQPPSRPSG